MEKINLNIQPQASIYSIFTRLNYSEWYALAEFVDNSTASFYQHEETLNKKAHFDKLTVEINYDSNADIITIEDDAYGMELDDFKRAILLDARPSFQGGRNEFGMGLKTAATWFGRRWSVESTEYGSENQYYAYIDLDEIIENQSNNINITKTKSEYDEHHTKITISKLNRKISTQKIKKKICEILQGMYRRDLASGKIEILFNGITLSFQEYTPLTFRKQIWKKDLSFSFSYYDKVYSVTGFVGILSKGGYDKAGFALFRRNRVVVGGLDENYKPAEIFVQAQSQIALKLYGEINMDSFDINQAKDGFSWDSELEELFVSNLKLAIMDYISVAKMSIKERQAEEEEERRKEEEEAKKKIAKENNEKSDPDENVDNHDVNNKEENQNSDSTNNVDNDESENKNNEDHEEINDKENDNTFNEPDEEKNDYSNCYHFEYCSENYDVFWQKIDKKLSLYEYYQIERKLIINLNHDFNIMVSKSERINVSKILLAYIIGESKAKLNSTSEGYVPTSVIRNQMSKVLSSIKTKN